MEKKYCVKCGNEIEMGAAFCVSCGQKVDMQEETVVQENTNSQSVNSGVYQTISRKDIKAEAKRIYKDNMWNIWKAILAVVGVSVLISIVASIFAPLAIVASLVTMPLSVGLFYYLINLVSGKEFNINQLFDFYKKNMLQIILAGFLVGLFTMLWSLLFVIPGIIAAISYSMVFYLYADGSDDSASETIKKSKLMMNGYKMDYFLFQLSFVGWFILCELTLGILCIWIVPYYMVANVLFLKKIKEIRG